MIYWEVFFFAIKGTAVDQPNLNFQSFIIKIWPEDETEEDKKGEWRGHITHIPSGERQHVHTLEGISRFIVHHMERMGLRQ